MKCPNCNSSVPGSWKICRCGYNLVAANPVEIPIYKKNAEATKTIKKRREFLQKTSQQQAESGDEMPSPQARRPTGDTTQILDTDSLVQKQKAEMLKASEAIRHRNVASDTTQIIDVSDNSMPATDPGYSNESGQSAQTVSDESAGISNKLIFHGSKGKYFLIFFVNRLLTIPTIGFYYFWGKVKERRYLHNQTSFEGDNFEYHARGIELLFGYLKISIILIAANSIQYIQMFKLSDTLSYIAFGVFILLWMFLYPAIVVLTIRFRYSRTSWRGIRFSFRGSILEFVKIYVIGIILIFLTLGIYSYFLHHKSREYLVKNAYFGDTKFEYNGNSWVLFKDFLKVYIINILIFICIGVVFYSAIKTEDVAKLENISYLPFISLALLIIPAIYWLRFTAMWHRYQWSHTFFSSMKFNLVISDWDYCKLKIINFIIFIFTLGLGTPVIEIRDLEKMCENLNIIGDLDFNTIIQDARSPSAVGEAVEDALDVDFMGLELGL